MKQFVLVLTVIIFSCAEASTSKSSIVKENNFQLIEQLLSLSKSQNYFELKAQFSKNKGELNETYVDFFEAILHNAFNNPEASNEAIERVMNGNYEILGDSLMATLYSKKINNHSRLFEYQDVAESNKFLRENYAEQLDSLNIEDLENTFNLYNALKEVPKQEIIRNKDVKIPITRDIAGLLNIDASFGETNQNMIFDTGANMSVIRKSLVEKFGMKLIESDFLVNAATGTKVKSMLAVADEFRIGDIMIKNEVFLVFDDSALSFPGYDIYGIIGFPVIEGLDEIQLTKDDELIIPKEANAYSSNNMAIDRLIPIVSLKYKEDSLIFKFDTGAQATTLFSKFHKDYKTEIEKQYTKEKFGAGSAGGSVFYEGYLIDDVNLKIGNSIAQLNNLQLHTEKLKESDANFHGNLGQDYIKQFDKMIISFEHSSLLFQ